MPSAQFYQLYPGNILLSLQGQFGGLPCLFPSRGATHTCAENSCSLISTIFRTVCRNVPSWGWNPSTAAAWKMSRMFWAFNCMAALPLGFSSLSVAFRTTLNMRGVCGPRQ